ncbi:MAG: 3'-5' exonuclease domain-containing protein 2 [Candidatus Aminicenantes bacterium]|nr:MAG: 3'-5' exonuclease domain-containing protein 2 [Candidatus Aminicenantes bacterium]
MANRLSKDYINSLPIVRFEGEVITVTTEKHAEEVLRDLMQETGVGFDTESKPSFKKGTFYPVSLVQIAAQDAAYLFQISKTGFTDGLVEFLENEDIKKIGVGIKTDIVKLQELRPFIPGGFVDLSPLAAEKGIIQVGVRGLTARYLRHRLPKTAQKTNWARSELSRKQQIYAATDAWICLQIYPYLLADTTDYRQFNEDENNNQRESGSGKNREREEERTIRLTRKTAYGKKEFTKMEKYQIAKYLKEENQ